jgi:hypothetical protein
LRCGLSIDAFWVLTPREVLLYMRAASERRLDRYDELMSVAWHEAMWGHAEITIKKMPELEAVFSRRGRAKKPRRLSLEAEIAMWDRWAKAGAWRGAN